MQEERAHEQEGRTTPQALRREVAVTFAASLVLIWVGLGLQAFIPGLSGFLYVLVALVFLLLPAAVVRRWRGEEPQDAGMRYGPIATGVLWGVGAALLTLAPFALGYHLWSTVVWERTGRFELTHYAQWTLESQGRPEGVRDGREGVYVWSEGTTLRVRWNAVGPLEVRVAVTEGASPPEIVQGPWGSRAQVSDEVLTVRGGGGEPAGFDAQVADPAASVEVDLRGADGERLLAEAVTYGLGGAPESVPLVLERGVWWILLVLLTQVFFVALPEEVFYRGYVQPTLGRAFNEGVEAREGGWGEVWASRRSIVAASVLFALGHLLVDVRAARLAVFFPSLVFGALRVRTGGLTAPLVYHALCNMMVELVVVHYDVV